MRNVHVSSFCLVAAILASLPALSDDRQPASAKAPPKDPPATQGYIPKQPSNQQQDPQLKRIEKGEKEAYQPKPSPSPSPRGGAAPAN